MNTTLSYTIAVAVLFAIAVIIYKFGEQHGQSVTMKAMLERHLGNKSPFLATRKKTIKQGAK